MKRKLLLLLFFCACQATALFAQEDSVANSCVQCSKYLYWTGEVNNDFFNERNWRVAVQLPSPPNRPDSIPGGVDVHNVKPSCLPGANKKDYQICLVAPDLEKDKHPKPNTLNPGEGIIYNLYANGATIDVDGAIVFNQRDKGITLENVTLNVQGSLQSGVLSINAASTIHFLEGNALGELANVNVLDSDSWIYFHHDNPDEVLLASTKLWVNDELALVDRNLRINQYYHESSIVRKKDLSYDPLTIYSGAGLSGQVASVHESIIYAGANIPSGMNNMTSSFLLKRGFMATFAIQENGTGKSKVYIASEKDLIVNDVPLAMQNNISFIRVMPWNWVAKKGVGSVPGRGGVEADWFYSWGSGLSSKPNYEYAPMTWGNGAATAASVNQLILKEKVTHLLGFNEPDNCSGQSGQYGNLCQPDVAVAFFENLMGTGLRLGSPAPRENGPTSWLKDFNKIAKERDVRFDFVAVHWYDWGSSPQNSPFEDPQKIFNRFKSYLANVYQIYGLPIWITEFNANPNRDITVNEAFLRLALPYLESLDYIERYAYFEPLTDEIKTEIVPAKYFDANGDYTSVGIRYRDHVSSPAIPELTYASPNNLEGMDKVFSEMPTEWLSFEAECGLYKGNKWIVMEDSIASNNYYIQANSLADGASALAHQTNFEFDSDQAQTLRLWVRVSTLAGTIGTLKIKMDDNEFETINQMNSADFAWFRIPRYYTVSKGKHRLSIAYANNGTKLDKVVLINNSTTVNSLPDESENACTLPGTGWGLAATDVTYFMEAESAPAGTEWQQGNDNAAIGGKFMQPAPGASAGNLPPENSGLLRFEFEIAADDEYTVWGKVQASSGTSDAFWFSVDGEPFRKWDNLQNKVYQWYWQKFYFSEEEGDRNFNYFLAQGHHTVVVAYSEAGAKLDRIAIASTQRNPALEDPNVLLKDPVMEFEAETATLLGTPAVTDCVTSSNGKIVNLSQNLNNTIRFSNVATANAGNYRLTVNYISKDVRNFKLIVNGVDLGANSNYSVISSGNWCFEGGAPGAWHKVIALNAGVNTIDLKAVATNAPFIDKISLVREFGSYEAESALRTGDVAVENCTRASNGLLANLKTSTSNSLLFNNVDVNESGTYYLDIHYVSKAARSARVIINGVSETISFEASGNWCYEAGPSNAPKVKSLQRALVNGTNVIEIKTTGAEAPLIDKISILKQPTEARAVSAGRQKDVSMEMEVKSEQEGDGVSVYPNPVHENGKISIVVSATNTNTFSLKIMNVNGSELYRNNAGIAGEAMTLETELKAGFFFIVVEDKGYRQVRKLIVR